MKSCKYLIISALLLGSLKLLAQGNLPDNFYASPVLISSTSNFKAFNFGTGMYVSKGNSIYLITAAHVLFNFASTNFNELEHENGVLTSFSNDGTNKSIMSLNLKRLLFNGQIRRHKMHDVAIIHIGDLAGSPINGLFRMSLASGVNAITEFAPVFWNESSLTPIDDLLPGDDVYITGYPVDLFNPKMPLEIDPSCPVVRKGIISQFNKFTDKIIVDSAVFGGNSGGPVWVLSRADPNVITVGMGNIRHDTSAFFVAGIVTQFVPYTTRVNPNEGITNIVMANSGYAVVEPAAYALELMNQFTPP